MLFLRTGTSEQIQLEHTTGFLFLLLLSLLYLEYEVANYMYFRIAVIPYVLLLLISITNDFHLEKMITLLCCD